MVNRPWKGEKKIMSNGKGLLKLATIVGVVWLSSAVADIARGTLIALNMHAKEQREHKAALDKVRERCEEASEKAKEAWARAEANAKKEEEE